MVRLTVNGIERAVEHPSGGSLLALLRDDLELTGTKYGCGEGECGACTVLLDGTAVQSCQVSADSADGTHVVTVEGLARDGRLHPVQQAFVDARAAQCGYCVPGMVMSTVALLAADGSPDDAAIGTALAGHICRCGGYVRIREAVRAAAETTGGPAPTAASAPPAERRGGWTITLPPADAADRGWGWTTPGGARLVLHGDGTVTVYVGKVDGGQGNRYGLARIVAAVLGLPSTAVRVCMGDTAVSPYDLGTFGSRSTPDAGRALHAVAAAARRAVTEAAAARWEVDPARLTLARGAVCDPVTGREIALGRLVSAGERTVLAGSADAPETTPAGVAAVDDAAAGAGAVAIVTGAKCFPSDLRAPGMLHARVLRPPARGARLLRLDTAAARALPDVTVVEDGEFVAVVAPTRAAATRALGALDAQWSEGDGPSEHELVAYLRAHPVDQPGWGGSVERSAGDVDTARVTADVERVATYTTAYIAHVPMEPRVALADVTGGVVTVWVGTQRPFAVRSEVAAAVGLAESDVRVVVPDFGGGFGGKHTGDVAVEAARLACTIGRPVRVAWSREEEFRHAYFRPAAVIDVRSSASRRGRLLSWEFTNLNSGAAGLPTPYAVPHLRERYQPADSPLAHGSYRALAATANTFARECHIDEVAVELETDAVELRLAHLTDERLAAVLRAAAEGIGWPHQPGGGVGVGVACGLEKDGCIATAAEVEVGRDRSVRVRRMVTAFDCGAVVDPDGLRSQVLGATVMGLGGALYEAVHFEGGRVLNPSLAAYRVPRLADVPAIEVILVDRPDQPSAGGGETPIIAVAPAIANAVFAATGDRIRHLPLAPGGRLRAGG